MAFAINGIALTIPEKHNWVVPNSYGTSLEGRPLYPGVFSYEMNWPALSATEFNFLVSEANTGTVVSSLPRWQGTPSSDYYEYYNYSGTFLGMPEFQGYFMGYYQNVKLVINNVSV